MAQYDDSQPARRDVQPQRKSGRVSFENDGRGIWEWQTATGVFTRNVTTDELMRLSDVELQIVEPPAFVAQSISTGVRLPATRRAVAKKPESMAGRLLRRLTR